MLTCTANVVTSDSCSDKKRKEKKEKKKSKNKFKKEKKKRKEGETKKKKKKIRHAFRSKIKNMLKCNSQAVSIIKRNRAKNQSEHSGVTVAMTTSVWP